MFGSSDWRRVSLPEEFQKSTDIGLMKQLTDERTVVQNKTRTNQSEFETYLAALNNRPESSLLFA